MVEVGDCTTKDAGGSVPDAEGLTDAEGLAVGSGEFSVLTELWTGDALGMMGTCEIGGIGEG